MKRAALTESFARMDIEHPVPVGPGAAGLHPAALRGIRLFNQREFFEAHEALETAWMAEPGPIRDLYRGILQVAVAYYHASRANWIGARKMFARSRRWLMPFTPATAGINVSQLLLDASRVEKEVNRRAGTQAPALDLSFFPLLSIS